MVGSSSTRRKSAPGALRSSLQPHRAIRAIMRAAARCGVADQGAIAEGAPVAMAITVAIGLDPVDTDA
jgi:hypothetical protein